MSNAHISQKESTIVPLALVPLSEDELSRRDAIKQLLHRKSPSMRFELELPEDAYLMQKWLWDALSATLQEMYDGGFRLYNVSAEVVNWWLDRHIWTKHCKCE